MWEAPGETLLLNSYSGGAPTSFQVVRDLLNLSIHHSAEYKRIVCYYPDRATIESFYKVISTDVKWIIAVLSALISLGLSHIYTSALHDGACSTWKDPKAPAILLFVSALWWAILPWRSMKQKNFSVSQSRVHLQIGRSQWRSGIIFALPQIDCSRTIIVKAS